MVSNGHKTHSDKSRAMEPQHILATTTKCMLIPPRPPHQKTHTTNIPVSSHNHTEPNTSLQQQKMYVNSPTSPSPKNTNKHSCKLTQSYRDQRQINPSSETHSQALPVCILIGDFWCHGQCGWGGPAAGQRRQWSAERARLWRWTSAALAPRRNCCCPSPSLWGQHIAGSSGQVRPGQVKVYKVRQINYAWSGWSQN